MLDHEMTAQVGPEEPQPEPWDPGRGLVGGRHPGGAGRGLADGAVLAGPAAEQSRQEPGHVPGGGPGGAAAHRDHLVVADRLGATGAQLVAGGQARPDPRWGRTRSVSAMPRGLKMRSRR